MMSSKKYAGSPDGPPDPIVHPRHHAIALKDLPDELRQSISSFGSVPVIAVGGDEMKPTSNAVVNKETARSWCMLVIAFIFQSLYGLAAFSPPVYYVTYVEYFSISKSVGAWIGSVYLFCCFVVGMVASTLVVEYGCRITTLCGALCMFVGKVVSSFAPDIITIYVFQSVIAGFGAGTTFIGVNVILPKYFGKHRAMASTFALSGMGVGMVTAPVLITFLMNMYGWRGAVLIESAILSHMVPLSLTFVEPHQKAEKLVSNQNGKHPMKVSSKEEGKENACLAFVHLLKSSFDFSMLSDSLFTVYCLSNFLTRVNSSTLVCHMPIYIVSRGLTLDQAAFVTAVSGGCCVAARFVASFLGSLPKINHLVVYGCVMLLNSASALLLLLLPISLEGLCAAAALFGFAFGFDYPFVPVILVQIMGVELLARAMAIYNLVSLAVVILAIPPLVGLIFDLTGSYFIPFVGGAVISLIGSALAFCTSVWLRRRLLMDECAESKVQC